MWNAIQKQFKIQWRDGLWMKLVMAGMALFGMALMYILAVTTKEEKSWFAMGTFLAGFAAAVACLVGTGLNFYTSFQIEVGFGCTRKHFFASFYLYSLATALMNVVVLWLIWLIENGIGTRLYEMETEVAMMPTLLWLGPFMALLLSMIGMTAAVLVMRFGKVAFWTLWVLWMVGFIGIPRFLGASKEHPGSVYGMLGKGLRGFAGALPLQIWLAVIFAVGVFLMAVSYRIVMRQQVAA